MDTMKKLGGAVAAAVLLVALAGCSGSNGAGDSETAESTGQSEQHSSQEQQEPIGGDVTAPITVAVDALQGADVELILGQVLNITTNEVPVQSYAADVSHPEVAEFTVGSSDGSAESNPGMTALTVGMTEVMLTSDEDPNSPITFTVNVIDWQ